MNQKSKKLFITGLLLTGILFLVYLFAAMKLGLWYDNKGNAAFLYQVDTDTFEGSYHTQNYKMTIAREHTDTHTSAHINFSVNDTSRNYYVTRDDQTREVDIYENDKIIFEGTDGGSFLLPDDFGDNANGTEIYITVDGSAAQLGDGFPSIYDLHKWTITAKLDTRGLLVMVIPMLLLLAYAVVDFLYPDLFFQIRYMFRFDVENPEPSDWYYTGQKIGRVICVIGAISLAVMSFMEH